MRFHIVLSIAGLILAHAGNQQAVASFQTKSVTRGVLTVGPKHESAADHLINGIAFDPRPASPQEHGVYYFEKTQAFGNPTDCSMSYTLLGRTSRGSAGAATASAHRYSAIAKSRDVHFGKSPLTLVHTPESPSTYGFGGRGSRSILKDREWQQSYSSYQNSNSLGGNFGGVGNSASPGAPNSSQSGPLFSSVTVEASIRPVLGNDSAQPATAAVPELSAMVVWALLSPFGALALTSRRSRRTN